MQNKIITYSCSIQSQNDHNGIGLFIGGNNAFLTDTQLWKRAYTMSKQTWIKWATSAHLYKCYLNSPLFVQGKWVSFVLLNVAGLGHLIWCICSALTSPFYKGARVGHKASEDSLPPRAPPTQPWLALLQRWNSLEAFRRLPGLLQAVMLPDDPMATEQNHRGRIREPHCAYDPGMSPTPSSPWCQPRVQIGKHLSCHVHFQKNLFQR